MYISPKMYHIRECFIQIGHLGLHILYNHFCVHSFHSVWCFPNDYHTVKQEKWNINDLNNINYNKVNDLFFPSLLKVCARLICLGDICPGGICPGGYMS